MKLKLSKIFLSFFDVEKVPYCNNFEIYGDLRKINEILLLGSIILTKYFK